MSEVFWFLAGFLSCVFYEQIVGKKKPKTEIKPSVTRGDTENENGESLHRAYRNGLPPFDKGDNPDPMMLRNGFGVTRDKNPTYAEQWVNIMNFDGSNQKEEDYGPGEDNSAEDMG